MIKKPTTKELEAFLGRGVAHLVSKKDISKKLQSGKKLRIYQGVDPSGPKVHLGHAVGLWKLRRFQDLGHEVIFLVGDFTGMIGDPTDRGAARTALTRKEVLENAADYKKQVSKILNFGGKNPAKLVFNSRWLDKITFKDLIGIAANFSVQQMLERDMYQERLKAAKPIYMHEFLYPIMQGYDSVALDVDVELAGDDQLFNALAGRTLMQKMKGKDKSVFTVELLEGTDGRKMSKSFKNDIGIMDSPDKMYGLIMSLIDDLIDRYFVLATDLETDDIERIKKEYKDNPRDRKALLAFEITRRYHGKKKASEAQAEFDKVFRDKALPKKIKSLKISADTGVIEALIKAGFVKSKGEARRKIAEGAVKINSRKIKSGEVELSSSDILQFGKLKYVKIIK